ncbi:MAG: HK97 family phage prohead protease [Marivita sp.]|uniref:HK97 family phage prohead protease n=1 Tax=Marivita sp. TaxID=2003365 RepID=UPI0025BBA33F|nr:HK97 family phage prohead protease [Marivita sp.]MCI5110405.1 HK97 family phage prohead protease [Marivita sp.]
MLTGFADGGLELRKRASGALTLQGRFPYNKRAVLSDGGRTGRPRKEVIASRAFAYRVERPNEDIHLLIGHSYDRPLASRGAGTLDLKDSDDALTFTASITEEMQEVSFVRDFLAAFRAGLIVGISPGFRIPPERAVAEAERVEEEDPSEGMALIRTILAALLYEISVVTRPAYDETQIEERNWQPGRVILPVRVHPSARWRA